MPQLPEHPIAESRVNFYLDNTNDTNIVDCSWNWGDFCNETNAIALEGNFTLTVNATELLNGKHFELILYYDRDDNGTIEIGSPWKPGDPVTKPFANWCTGPYGDLWGDRFGNTIIFVKEVNGTREDYFITNSTEISGIEFEIR